jgi:hypothetical protein
MGAVKVESDGKWAAGRLLGSIWCGDCRVTSAQHWRKGEGYARNSRYRASRSPPVVLVGVSVQVHMHTTVCLWFCVCEHSAVCDWLCLCMHTLCECAFVQNSNHIEVSMARGK